jgi:plastocyanin
VIVWLLVLLGLGRAPTTHTVEIRGMEFHPAVLTVAAGDTVVWVNRDIVPHTATATGRPKWDTGQLTQGQTGRYIARARGTARYACTLHPTMHGKLIITNH